MPRLTMANSIQTKAQSLKPESLLKAETQGKLLELRIEPHQIIPLAFRIDGYSIDLDGFLTTGRTYNSNSNQYQMVLWTEYKRIISLIDGELFI